MRNDKSHCSRVDFGCILSSPFSGGYILASSILAIVLEFVRFKINPSFDRS